MAKVLGVGGIFFKSPDPQRLYDWYAKWLGLPVLTEAGVTFAHFPPAGMPPGGYTVAIDAPAAWRDTSLAGVGVMAGQVTSVGTIALQVP